MPSRHHPRKYLQTRNNLKQPWPRLMHLVEIQFYETRLLWVNMRPTAVVNACRLCLCLQTKFPKKRQILTKGPLCGDKRASRKPATRSLKGQEPMQSSQIQQNPYMAQIVISEPFQTGFRTFVTRDEKVGSLIVQQERPTHVHHLYPSA